MDAQSRPSARVAFWLSVMLPGLGLLYVGAPLRGIAVFLLALAALGGIADSLHFHDTRPEYLYYGALAVAVLTAAWWGGAWHARNLASRHRAWPALYLYLARPQPWRALARARTEVVMASIFAVFTTVYLVHPRPPHWLPEAPRYWFLYEAFGALYPALAAQARVAGFVAISLVATALLALLTEMSKTVLILAYVLALPSCWQSLRRRGDDATRVHGMRFAACLLAGLLAFLGYGLLVVAWEMVSGQPQYRMRLVMDAELVLAVFGLLYYLVRAALEVLASGRWSEIRVP